jgi:hypothetical protein
MKKKLKTFREQEIAYISRHNIEDNFEKINKFNIYIDEVSSWKLLMN